MNGAEVISAVIFVLSPLKILRNLKSCTFKSIKVDDKEFEECISEPNNHIYLNFQQRLQSDLILTMNTERSFITKGRSDQHLSTWKTT
jgi:hypothetical protein